jgi:hypothetical protein
MIKNRKVLTRNGLLLILTSLLVTIVVKEVLSLRRQDRMLNEGRSHVAAIQDDWEIFEREELGVRGIILTSSTNPMGSILVRGIVQEEAQITKIKEFLNDTRPPHGISLRGLRVSGER